VLTKTVRADPIVVWANQSFCNVHGYEAVRKKRGKEVPFLHVGSLTFCTCCFFYSGGDFGDVHHEAITNADLSSVGTIHYCPCSRAPVRDFLLCSRTHSFDKFLLHLLGRPPKSVSPIFDVLFRHRHKQGRAVMLDCRIQLCYGYDNLVCLM